MGPISREGSSTTAVPRQVSMEGTPIEVVLKPPGPLNTRAWVEPVRHESISSGAVPPLTPGAPVRRIERPAGHAILIDAIRLADDDAATGLVGAGEVATRVADGQPVGMAEIVRPATNQARADGAEAPLERQLRADDRG